MTSTFAARRVWTPEEDEFLLWAMETGEPRKVIAETLDRTVLSLYSRMASLADPKGRTSSIRETKARGQEETERYAVAHRAPWTAEDEEELIRLNKTHTDGEIAITLGRTWNAIAARKAILRRRGIDI